MKQILILTLSLLSVNTIYAQTSNDHRTSGFHSQVLTHLLQTQKNEALLKITTGVPTDRVIAQSTHDNMLVSLSDSVDLKYHKFRGSVYDYNTMIYPYNYPYSTTPMFNYAGVFTKPQVLYDTLIHWTVSPFTLVYGLYETEYATYDSVTNNLKKYKHTYIDSTLNRNRSYVD